MDLEGSYIRPIDVSFWYLPSGTDNRCLCLYSNRVRFEYEATHVSSSRPTVIL
jgi:hypothetical protein